MNKLFIEDSNCITSVRIPIDNQVIHLESAAYNLMRDFNVSRPILIEDGMKAVEAVKMLSQCHVNWFVIVNELDVPTGVLQKEQIQAQEIIKKVAQGYKREDVTIADVMTDKQRLKAISIETLLSFKVESLLRQLRHCQSNLLLVTDSAETELRGIITVEDVLHKLQLDYASQYCHSFEELFGHIHNQREKLNNAHCQMVS